MSRYSDGANGGVEEAKPAADAGAGASNGGHALLARAPRNYVLPFLEEMKMKRSWLGPFAALAIAVPTLAWGEVHSFEVDPVHSEVAFRVRHLMAKSQGRFNDFAGTVWLDPADVAGTLKIEGKVQVASIDTRNEKRDGHLKSADFFEVEKYPEMTLLTKSVKKQGEKIIATAQVTIRGVTKPVDFEIDYSGVGTNPFTGTPTTGLELSGRLNRKDFGMMWNKALDTGGFVLDDVVEVTILLEASVPAPEEKS
jgi:polyisoprenoid-binding protein YceI